MATVVPASRPRVALGVDARNLLLIVVAWAFLVALVPAARSFPVTDDWIYARSVTDLLNGAYHQSDWSQTTALAHVAWGALFAAVLGLSFTTLGLANLVMALICLLTFYVLLRHLDVSSAASLLGVAPLGSSALFVYLSYS